MSSLTLKGKPSEHVPIVSSNANTSLTSATSDASSGMCLEFGLLDGSCQFN